ncbi:polysaccharide deacetylase family protein [Halomonas sp. TRM85114]|uniref:polysaccharide deacetylase family protein n=1 Tax=Halomonas jincaotanensis TaxID=2810616 RepID=UPI001BD47073|nr:polysaccharide deacetylase family protein [Halomonas jincaotanensis]MBS9404040.1 polysaccharide deacetylase family protein [Halomonas jincaotanensis]
MQNLTIVMYHYVRPLADSRYPELKALELDRFRGQLAHIDRHYHVVDMEQLIAAVRPDGEPLPENPLLLTFDDGYMDHFEHVLPLLSERGWQGSFFPPACSVVDRRVLDVNKLHFVLASVSDPEILVKYVYSAMNEARDRFGLEANEAMFARLAGDSRYDDPCTAFVKRALQRELPEAFRTTLVDELFSQYVSSDEQDFAAELYMSEKELTGLLDAGMFIGSHGCQHYWLNSLDRQAQIEEVDNSLDFMERLGVSRKDWVMCYPYGGYDESLLGILRSRGCAIGLTTEVRVADIDRCDPLALPRLDTNDLPTSAASAAE